MPQTSTLRAPTGVPPVRSRAPRPPGPRPIARPLPPLIDLGVPEPVYSVGVSSPAPEPMATSPSASAPAIYQPATPPPPQPPVARSLSPAEQQLASLDSQRAALLSAPPENRNSKLGSFLQMFLRGVGPGQQQAQAMAAARGERVGAFDFLAGLASAGGQGAATLVPGMGNLDEIAARDEQLAAIDRQRGPLREQINAEGEAELRRATLAKVGAETNEITDRPVRERVRLRGEQLERAVSRLVEMHQRAGRYSPDDPSDAASQQLKAEEARLRASGADVSLVPYARDEKPQVYANGQLSVYDPRTKTLAPVTDRGTGQPVVDLAKVPVKVRLQGGQEVAVEPGTAYSSEPTGGRVIAQMQHADRREDRRYARQDAHRNEDDIFQTLKGHMDRAGADLKKFRDALTEAKKYEAGIKQQKAIIESKNSDAEAKTKARSDLAYYEAALPERMKEVWALAGALGEAFPGLFLNDQDNWPNRMNLVYDAAAAAREYGIPIDAVRRAARKAGFKPIN